MNNLSNLLIEIKNWAERTDISDDQVRSFIGMVEDNFKGDFHLPANETTVALTTDANGQVTIPIDFLKVKRMTALDSSGEEYTIYRKPNDVVISGQAWDSESELYFERKGNHFFFAPTVGEGRTITLTYYNIVASLVASSDDEVSNFVLNMSPQIYLFGALMYLFLFTYNEEKAVFYEKLFEKAKRDLVEVQEKAEMAGSRMSVFPSMSE